MIFRFNFETTVADELCSFAKINQHVDRAEYKEKWEEWLQENAELVSTEKRRLESLGYKGDVITKMFKSARYYFREKKTTEPKQRGEYAVADKAMLEIIDEFLRGEICNPGFTPRKSFENFCQHHSVSKKTFKNRYYLLTKKN